MTSKPSKQKQAKQGNGVKIGGGGFSISMLCAFLFSTFLLSESIQAKEKRPHSPTNSEVKEKKDNLKELHGQIENLRQEMASTEGKRANVADQLKDIEQSISVTQRDLHNLATQRSELQGKLKDLSLQSRELENNLNGQQAQLEKLVYRQYLQGSQDSLRLLLNGDDPNQMARDLHYLAAIGGARQQLLHNIETSLQRKQALADDTRQRAEELTAIESRQNEQHEKLVTQRKQRQEMLDAISSKISEQRRTIGNLQRDEKQLAQLIERLAKVIATRPPPRKEPKATVEKTTPEKRQAGKENTAKEPAVEINNENTPEASSAGSFAHLRGSLHLPTKGVVTNRYGSARQEGSTWKGLFIRASQGSDVKAIAAGRVVFAEWMRGFGNLIIVDHGNSYLSIYGNNEALLKQVGDNVHGGDSIASVGNSGGNPESGLYFELRNQGQPLDPLKWVNLK